MYQGYRSVIATISAEDGVILLQIQPHAIDHKDFINYLKKLRQMHGTMPLALFMDNLPVHIALDVQPFYSDLDIVQIKNVGYSPQFNPIESTFSKVKALFNRVRLNCLVNRIGFNFERTIKAAFSEITPEHCANCAKMSFRLLQKAS